MTKPTKPKANDDGRLCGPWDTSENTQYTIPEQTQAQARDERPPSKAETRRKTRGR